jgi:hypothetical protein
LHERAGQQRAHGLDEFLDEVEVSISAQTVVRPAEILIVAEQFLVVGPEIETDGQRIARIDAGTGRIQCELSEGNSHSASPLVTDAEDGFVVRHHDQTRAAGRSRILENLDHATLHVGRDPQTPALLKHVAEALRGQADGRRVDNRHELFEMLAEHTIEENLVTIAQRCNRDVFLQRIGVPGYLRVDASCLLVERLASMRQQPLDAERAPLLRAECRALVQQRGSNQLETALADLGGCCLPWCRGLGVTWTISADAALCAALFHKRFRHRH